MILALYFKVRQWRTFPEFLTNFALAADEMCSQHLN
jgi:hypothetical protein